MKKIPGGLRLILLALFSLVLAAVASGQTITEFTVPTSGGAPYGIGTGPDGALWFAERSGNKVGRITTSGVFTEFPVLTAGSQPIPIRAGPDGNLWFGEAVAGKIGRVTPSGVVTEFPIPTGGSDPIGIAAGPDGNVWFVEFFASNIGRITPTGTITEFPTGTGGQPDDITLGPDGNLWFSEQNEMIGKITPTGTITEFPTAAGTTPVSIAAGPDGALWFTEYGSNKIGRITTSGVITEYPIPTVGSAPYGIAAGPDGALWFTEFAGNKIGRITTSGVITEYPIPTAGSAPFGIAAGPDGALWFTESSGNKIGRITTETRFAALYVSNVNSNDVTAIDEFTRSVVATIPVGSEPRNLAANPNGTRVYVPNRFSDSVSVIATASNTVVATVTDNSFFEPYAVALTPSGGEAWVVNKQGGGSITGSVTIIKTATDTVTAVINDACFFSPEAIAMNPVTARAYVVNRGNNTVCIVDTASRTVLASVAVGSGPRYAVVTPSGGFVYVSGSQVTKIDTSDNSVTTLSTSGRNMAITPAGDKVYVPTQSSSIDIIATATDSVSTLTFPGASSTYGVAISPRLLGFVTDESSDNVRVFDTLTDTEVTGAGLPIAAGSTPRAIAQASSPATFFGPTPYLSKADSPFLANINAGLTYLETMECGLITVPGVTPSAGSVVPPGFLGLIDSVDADDGFIDGSGLNGHSFFFGSGSTGIDFTFSAAVLGALPTEAGIVWTDGGGTTTFEAFDAGGTSLGMVGPVSIADGSNSGTTAEDRFFGVRYAGGISKIHISNTSGGIEVDHLQYGLYAVTTATADLSIAKSDSLDPVATGATLTYTLDVSNAGPSATCSAVTVTDTLPAGVSFVSASGAGWSCTQSGGVVTCTLASLSVGAAPSITIQVTAPSSPGSITNSAVVSSQTPDPVPSNNTASATTTVGGPASADLQTTKTGPATVTAGTNVVYAILVKNNGPGNASAVTVSDATPAGLTFVSNSGACTTAFPCSLGTVNNGQMLLITSTFSVPLSYVGPNPISNTASVSSTTADPTPGNNSSTATTTVTGSGPPSLSIGSVAVVKPASGTVAAVFPVTMSAASALDVVVLYASFDGTAHAGTDYQAVSSVLTIPSGATSSSITVLVNGNTIASDDKAFTVTLFGPSNAVIGAGAGVGTGLIQDRTALPSLSIGDVSVAPVGSGTTPAVFPVTLSGATSRTVSVNYSTADGTATAGNGDYLPLSGTLFFAPGETSKTIPVQVVGKPFVAPSNFFVDLSPAVNATVARSRGTASIDRAFPSLSVGDAAVQSPGSAVFSVNLSVASTETITVSFTTADRTAFAGIDYTALSGVLTFAPGETTKSVTVLILPGGTVFPTKVFQLILSNPTGAILVKSLGEAAIFDQSKPLPPGPYIYIDDVSVVRPGSSFALWASVSVRLTGPSAVTINLAYATRDGTAHAGTDYLPTSGTLTIAPGETMKRILVPVLRAPAGTPGRSFEVSLAGAAVIPVPEAAVSIIPPGS